MKEIVVISGKGGTGKTSLTAAFAYLGGRDIIAADCDVDAADMHLLMQPDFAKSEDFYSGQLAKIDPAVCSNCGACAEVCRFDAVQLLDGQHYIDRLSCEGCGYCPRVCPEEAVIMEEQNVGQWYKSAVKNGSIMIHARLGIGAENSGKLVAKVKNEAKLLAKELNTEFVLVDGSPGIGCPVVSSLSGADFVVLVTEPTVSGLHDLKRVFELVNKFHISAGCIINKADINPQVSAEIESFLEKEKIKHIASLPYDESFTEAVVNGLTIVEYSQNSIKETIKQSWETIKQTARENK